MPAAGPAFRLCAVTRPDVDWPRTEGDLVLVLPTPTLLDAAVAWRERPETLRWFLSTDFDPDRFRRSWLASIDDPDDHAAVALLRGEPVGTVGMDVLDAPAQTHLEPSPGAGRLGRIGYVVAPDHYGRGIGTAMVRAMLRLGFEELGLHRIVAECFAPNTGSWRVMEKAGMRRESATRADTYHAEFGWIDSYGYAMLAEEWPTGAATVS